MPAPTGKRPSRRTRSPRATTARAETGTPRSPPRREAESDRSGKASVVEVEATSAPPRKRAGTPPPDAPAEAKPLRKRTRREAEVIILSRKRSLYSTRRLVEATRKLGRRVRVVDTLRCTVLIGTDGNQVLAEGRPLDDVSVVVPRIGASITGYGLAVVNQLDMMGIPVLNNSIPIARSRDKLRCLQLLARFGVDVPRTAMAHHESDADQLVAAVGGLPVVVKLLKGTQGVGVMLASTMEEVRSFLETFSSLGEDIVLQEFIAESAGRDVRALVVGDRVVAAMRRRAGGGEFRSNLHRGGTGEGLVLAPAWEALAVRAARIVGLEVAGVDMLEKHAGPCVMELNSSPGLEGVERTSGIDVAGAVMSYALEFSARSLAGWRRPRLI